MLILPNILRRLAEMTWLIPFSSTTRMAHFLKTDRRGHGQLLCTQRYANAAIAEYDERAPRCLRCSKMAGPEDTKLALQESWSLPAHA